MNHSLDDLIERFARLHVLVLGEAMLDSYLEGTTGRLCQEAPVPVVDVARRLDLPGGAANAAANARALGAEVALLSVIGDDFEGQLLRQALDRHAIATHGLLGQAERRTLAKHRVVAGSQLLVRFDQGSKDMLDATAEQKICERLRALWPLCDAVIVSDYSYGILTPGVLSELALLQRRHPRALVADSRRLGNYQQVRPTAVKPNFGEALRLLGANGLESPGSRADWVAARGDQLLELTGARIVAVTLDTEGALVFERDRPPYRTYAQPAQHTRASGAGDTFVATLALALAAGGDTPAAADLASAAAAVVVAKDGTSTCSARELRAQVREDDKRVWDLEAFADRLASDRAAGRRIVFTNGCFDILHRGHVSYLSRAKALGDILVVGVNSDASIRRLKGPSRPINTLDDRVQVLAALSCVDHVVPFEEDTPHALIRLVRPNIFVKGGDYTRDRLPEADLVEQLGGQVRILPSVADRSTTNIIERIRTVHPLADGEPPRLAPLTASWDTAVVRDGHGARA